MQTHIHRRTQQLFAKYIIDNRHSDFDRKTGRQNVASYLLSVSFLKTHDNAGKYLQ